MPLRIVDDERRRDRPRSPSALRVAAGWPRLLCRSSSTMFHIAFVVASRIRGHRAGHKRYRNYEQGYLAWKESDIVLATKSLATQSVRESFLWLASHGKIKTC